jgi:D-glycero-D-manno-heptose 1,7-bisphosphate phosphatase
VAHNHEVRGSSPLPATISIITSVITTEVLFTQNPLGIELVPVLFGVCYDEHTMRAIFLDRDGTINAGIPKYERVDSPDKVELLPNVVEGLRLLATLDYTKFFVTNQAGLAEGHISQADFYAINDEVLRQISPSGIQIAETYVCPHGEHDNCECRKPKPKLLQDAASKYDIDLASSWMIGDRLTDMQTGINAGTKTILVQTGAISEAQEATYVAADLLDAAQYIAAH